MNWLRWFFGEWGKRCTRSLVTLLVFGPLIGIAIHAAEDRIDSAVEWLWGLIAVVLPLAFGKWWPGLFDGHRDALSQNPAEKHAARLLAVADSVTDLPGGIEFSAFCHQLNEKEAKKLLHRLHQIRPGERHLRDVLPKI